MFQFPAWSLYFLSVRFAVGEQVACTAFCKYGDCCAAVPLPSRIFVCKKQTAFHHWPVLYGASATSEASAHRSRYLVTSLRLLKKISNRRNGILITSTHLRTFCHNTCTSIQLLQKQHHHHCRLLRLQRGRGHASTLPCVPHQPHWVLVMHVNVRFKSMWGWLRGGFRVLLEGSGLALAGPSNWLRG